MRQVGSAAGHSHGGTSPSRTHAYVHAESPRTCSNLPGVSDGNPRASRRGGIWRMPAQGALAPTDASRAAAMKGYSDLRTDFLVMADSSYTTTASRRREYSAWVTMDKHTCATCVRC